MYRGKKKLTEKEREERDLIRKRIKMQRVHCSRFKDGCERAVEAGRKGGLERARRAAERRLQAAQQAPQGH